MEFIRPVTLYQVHSSSYQFSGIHFNYWVFIILQAKGGKSLDLSDTTYTLSGSLQQAKEILRLARAMKAEAEQMKEEAYRELELARRERHDASLLKKNAAEILKIAKRKLASK